jgi:thiamine-phosphate pyrophosphorylase
MKGKLFIVTNRKLIPDGDLCRVAKACVRGGADAIILREKDLNKEELYKLTIAIKEATNGNIPIIINGNYEVSIIAKAEGIQLSYNDFLNFSQACESIKGVSIHSVEEAKIVNLMDASYILAGHIYNTECKKGLEGRGLKFLEEITKNVNIPVVAIGGIDLSNALEVIKSGAHGISVMSSVMKSDDPEKLIKGLKQTINY